ncbi:related to Rad50-interacting protein 1 [Cephalotrichum gorgonifer]|uniref:Related to Rad50-interacting protein 1 n=1 Tax=Cephalotrichum gorgonifer TaxID=2041049 RepID=A0AAE8N3P6_9PEZI|nr:related to Rad50-interacting protein 1 [Cephalotrichum gorgonifer]
MAAMSPFSASNRAHDGPLDLRVEDYLDDKLQSTTDLDTLDELLAKVELQQVQLRSQLDDATKELANAKRTADERQLSLVSRIDEFQELQNSIDSRARAAADADAPNEAIARLKVPMKKLRAVKIAQKYLGLLQDVDNLRTEARSHLPQNPKAALEPYTKLRKLAIRLRELQEPADDAAVHLVTHVTVATDMLWDEMKKTMSREMESILSARGWPNKIDPSHAEMDEEWLACFEKLLDLQFPELLYTESTISLLPFDVMSGLFISEFRFHFMSDKPTSNPQNTNTHCFPWFLGTISKWEDFLRDNLGHLLAAKFHDTPAAERMVYVDPVCAFITSMMPVMREKVRSVMREAARNPTFLSSFLGQLMDFDDNIRGNFSYDGGDPAGWPGLTSEVLDEWFEQWFQAEKQFALERFRAIMESPDARSIDYNYGGVGKTKPTHGATRVTDLLKSVTSQYRRVTKFKHKLRFFIGIQLDVLDEFHDRLRGSLEAYGAITSTVGRTLHGVTKEQQAALEGIGALETLCKVFGSADHIVVTLTDWSNEEFFVSLWDELQSRTKGTEEQPELSSELTFEEVKDRTSNAMGSDSDDGGLFDETIAAYKLRRKAAGDFLVSALADSHSKAFRAYLSRTHWTPTGDDPIPDPSQMAITAELDEPLSILKRNLDFLHRAIGTAPFRKTFRLALERLQDSLWSDILTRQSFTALGAAQFSRDLEAISSLVEKYIPGGSASLSTVLEGARLLSLPVAKEAEADADTESAGGPDLKAVSDRVFTDNTEAKKVLEELGVEILSPANARHILQRRVENAE